MVKTTERAVSDSEIVERYADMLYRICITHLAAVEPSAVDDACQNVFLKYVKYSPKFKDATHEKAWFIRCAINECKNICAYRFRHNHVPLSDIESKLTYTMKTKSDDDIMIQLWKLPTKYKDVMHLYYIEEMSAADIALNLNISEQAVCQRLKRGREKLKLQIENGREDI